MASLGNLFFKIGADVTEATKGIKEVKTQLESIKKITGFTAIIQGATAAINVFKSLAGAVGPLINEFDKAAKGAAKLETALKGNAAGTRQLIDQANQLAGTRLFPSDTTVNAQSVLATLGFTKTAILQLTPVIQDFASSTGVELDQAFRTVGKTIAFGGDGLKKYGVIVGQTVSPAQRFTETINGLTKAYGGQAEAAAKVGAGPLQLLVQRFSQIKEIAGESLVKFVNELLPLANEGITGLVGLLQSLPKYAANVGKAIVTVLRPFTEVYARILSIDSALGSPLQKIQQQIQVLLGIEKEAANAGRRIGGTLWHDLGEGVGDFAADATRATKELIKIKDAFSGLTLVVERNANGIARSLFIQDKENEILRENTALLISINSEIDKRANQLGRDLHKSLIDEKILTLEAVAALNKYIEAQKRGTDSLFEAAAARARAVKAFQDAQGGPTPQRGLESQAQEEEEAFLLPSGLDKTKNLFKGLFASVKDEDTARLTDIFQTKGIKAYNEEVAKLNGQINTTNDILGNMGNAAVQAFAGLASSLLDGSLAFKDLGRAALDAARQIINAALASAIAAAIAGSLKNSFNVIAGLALAAVAIGLVTALFKNKVPKLAKGGLAYGPQLAVVGDNPNASRDPEVISPLSKLHELIKGEMYQLASNMANAMDLALRTASVTVPDVNPNAIEANGPQEIIVKGEIDGSVIRLSYDRSASTHAKFQPRYY